MQSMRLCFALRFSVSRFCKNCYEKLHALQARASLARCAVVRSYNIMTLTRKTRLLHNTTSHAFMARETNVNKARIGLQYADRASAARH